MNITYALTAEPAQAQLPLERIAGHEHIKRALEVAIAGHHSITLAGWGEDAPLFAVWAQSVAELDGLVSLMPYCPCGHYGDFRGQCQCSAKQIMAYQRKARYRIAMAADIIIEVGREDAGKIARINAGGRLGEPEAVILARARAAHVRRADIAPVLDEVGASLLRSAASVFIFSQARIARVIEVGRTIAELAGAYSTIKAIHTAHIAEAIQYRPQIDARI